MHLAMLWKPLANGVTQCRLCSHYCRIQPGATGRCGVRVNQDGALHTLVFDRVAALNLDPVEKKPLFHFLPGTVTFSLGTMGCNLSCSFCQNFSLSQPPREGRPVQGQHATPEDIVAGAKRLGARSISYTYSEPTVFSELVLATATRAVAQGLKNILVSNGFQSPQCLDALGPYIHAANIDLKAFTDAFYRQRCGARLAPVLATLKHIVRLGWWLEVTTLVIPGLNDSAPELRDIARFIHDELGPDVPWHVSRFHPTHRLTDRPPTPVATLERAWTIGRDAGLRHVYLGNVRGHPGEHTLCPACGGVAVERVGFSVAPLRGAPGVCPACGTAIAGVGWDTLEARP
ncbi:MAG: AmmeMemoRadiSam system radical SAM enzyme [Desulfovibrionaceae bacterium]